MLSTVINAPGFYQTQDISERLQIIETYRTRWLINQALVALYAPLTVVGFALLASTLRTTAMAWIPPRTRRGRHRRRHHFGVVQRLPSDDRSPRRLFGRVPDPGKPGLLVVAGGAAALRRRLSAIRPARLARLPYRWRRSALWDRLPHHRWRLPHTIPFGSSQLGDWYRFAEAMSRSRILRGSAKSSR